MGVRDARVVPGDLQRDDPGSAPRLSRIVVATDMSARSDRAVERAFQLGAALDIPVEALLVLDDALPEDLLAPLHEKAETQLKAICEPADAARVRQSLEGVSGVEKVMVSGLGSGAEVTARD